MPTQVFVNLPTRDLDRSKEFFSALDWSIEPNFTDKNAACVVIDENIYLMMLTYDFFATFTDKPIMDPAKALQVQTALSCDSRDDVDALLEKALAAGGAEPRPAQDMGFMYSRDFEDPDGNWFSILWMDPKAAEQGPEAFMAQHHDGA
ncbi:VOC family protein [Arthrobacter glacialis]|uniref:Glyoxalase n=1 Tax=Arthrobacter glacialis TaxID=1664 RepID=A0A2S3ZZ21_ARTGL|nr:VOC family protein [Arthrobacter glacialis]POH57313.1 glyoxalase [Arthrobacter glacialis]POH74279.1 glyoxalase [Arthrobacter glacialis]